ncbi:hypothetical protein CENSYa_0975 [Cenarchaeum symbiosum A]|uniref:Uncharacterized protein n=1 Tax=Cenarchaeum symbiosum (strain A) TaxID=414004 RepID=A0RW90_CENSY|nr:hypothetical protein CENSYa_0975 [Cenarchaeum symbiosum A]
MAQLMENVEKEACMYKTISYESSEYLLDDNTRMVIHLNLNKVSRTSLFDLYGDRIYLCDFDSSMVLYP